MSDEAERPFGKRDRLARMLRVVTVLRGHPATPAPAITVDGLTSNSTSDQVLS